MEQEYNITNYDIAGPPEPSPYGKLQGFWLTLEGVDAPVIWNKKVEGGAPKVGPIWAKLESKTSQKGKQYFKFVKVAGPGHTTTAVAPRLTRPLPLSQGASQPLDSKRSFDTSEAWNGALNVAALALQHNLAKEDLLELAQWLYDHRPGTQTSIPVEKPVDSVQKPKDILPTEEDINNVNTAELFDEAG